jgi:hypothetical protein
VGSTTEPQHLNSSTPAFNRVKETPIFQNQPHIFGRDARPSTPLIDHQFVRENQGGVSKGLVGKRMEERREKTSEKIFIT